MIARNLITDEIPPLKLSDSGLKALQWMEEFKVSHLPVVEKGEYVGLVSDNELMDLNDPEKSLGDCKLNLVRPFVFDGNHIYEIIKLVHHLHLTLVPVINPENLYQGSVSLSRLVEGFSGIAAVSDPGGIIILELNSNDYSLSQISGIIEGNDAKVLSLYLSPVADSTMMQVVIKVNRTDLSGILQTFNRYDYTVTASFHESPHEEDFRQRYDSFMNYLNI